VNAVGPGLHRHAAARRAVGRLGTSEEVAALTLEFVERVGELVAG